MDIALALKIGIPLILVAAIVAIIQVKVKGKFNSLGYFCTAVCIGAGAGLLLYKLL